MAGRTRTNGNLPALAMLKVYFQKREEEREKNMEALSRYLSEVHLSPEEAAAILKKEMEADKSCVA